MFTRKTTKTLILLILILFTLSNADGDELYCISLKREFKISSNIHYGIMDADFEVKNAELYNVLHKPRGWVMVVYKEKDGSGVVSGGALVFAGSVRLKFFYDDFVVIKKKSGVKLDDIKLTLQLKTDEEKTGENTYDFTNKDLNIRKCKNRPY
ncbi:MAG: hypothetical protein H7843_16185 [Nitrospirota bacterium]